MDSIPITIKKRGRCKGYLVSAVYRQALLDLGFSPDAHIYDVTSDYFRYERGSASNLFIKKVKKFYDSLEDLMRRIFLCEFLEAGRHYPFWWMEFASQRDYERGVRRVAKLVEQAF